MKSSRVLLLLALAGTVLGAQDTSTKSSRPVSGLLGMGLTAGGDTLATATYTDGDTKSIKAGGLWYFKAGIDWRVAQRVSVQATFGIHGDSVNAKNGDMRFERNFAEGIAFWHTLPTQRLGLGLRKTSDAKLKSSGVGNFGTIDFDSSTGLVLEYEWYTRNAPLRCGWGLRYVSETYRATSWDGLGVRGKDVDGSHLGAFFNFYF